MLHDGLGRSIKGGEMSSPAALEYGIAYHIFTRGINRENIFFEERNYRRFLRLFGYHVAPFVDTYAYCLLRNHIHFFVRTKTKTEIRKSIEENILMVKDSPIPPGQRIGNLLNAYAKSINHAYHRTGSLFQHPFGRVLVFHVEYHNRLVRYIHQNPQRHGLVKDFRDWPFSSYQYLHAVGATDENMIPITRWKGNPQPAGKQKKESGSSPFGLLVADDFF
jgi:putative transposase